MIGKVSESHCRLGFWTELDQSSTLNRVTERIINPVALRTMKSTVFVRPNLKMFFLGALMIAAVQQLISNVHSQGQGSRPVTVNARELENLEVDELMKRSAGIHSPELYMRISQLLQQKGDYRRALLFLRRADKVEQVGSLSED